MLHFREIEVKHDAKNVSLAAFQSLVKELFTVKKDLSVISSDDYFMNSSHDYIRYRHRPNSGELTIKRKLSKHDNNKRIEVNLPTAGNNLEAVSQFAELLGYKHNFCINKNSQVYWVDDMVICYYVVFDEQRNEKGRFIEIEADEDYAWETESQALDAVAQCERLFEPLGLGSKSRLKKSLFELFKRD